MSHIFRPPQRRQCLPGPAALLVACTHSRDKRYRRMDTTRKAMVTADSLHPSWAGPQSLESKQHRPPMAMRLDVALFPNRRFQLDLVCTAHSSIRWRLEIGQPAAQISTRSGECRTARLLMYQCRMYRSTLRRTRPTFLAARATLPACQMACPCGQVPLRRSCNASAHIPVSPSRKGTRMMVQQRKDRIRA